MLDMGSLYLVYIKSRMNAIVEWMMLRLRIHLVIRYSDICSIFPHDWRQLYLIILHINRIHLLQLYEVATILVIWAHHPNHSRHFLSSANMFDPLPLHHDQTLQFHKLSHYPRFALFISFCSALCFINPAPKRCLPNGHPRHTVIENIWNASSGISVALGWPSCASALHSFHKLCPACFAIVHS